MKKFWLSLAVSLMLTSGSVGLAQEVSDVEQMPEPPVVHEHLLPAHEHTWQCEETEAEPVQIICILDRSGSMQNLTSDTIGGYNSFIAKQKEEPGQAEVTTVLFDDQYEKLLDAVDLNEVPEMTSKEYFARGSTALLDAVGRTLMDTAGKMEKDTVCPAKRRVIVLIMTDGLENASREYKREAVKSMIEEATDEYGWNFIFMGANIDSVAEAGALGISSNYAMDYAADAEGINESFDRMGKAAQSVRTSGTVDEDWKN